MLFLFVFGSRVNAIIGNLATAIIYPILAAAAGLTFLIMISPDRYHALIGTSGAHQRPGRNLYRAPAIA